MYIHYSKKLKEYFDIMIFIERYPLKRCQGCVKLSEMDFKEYFISCQYFLSIL